MGGIPAEGIQAGETPAETVEIPIPIVLPLEMAAAGLEVAMLAPKAVLQVIISYHRFLLVGSHYVNYFPGYRY